MKIEIKMTQRDKKLLKFLGFFLVIIAFYLMVIRPGLDRITVLQEEIALSEQTKFEMQEKISTLPALEKGLVSAAADWTEVSAFIYDLMSSQEVDKMVTAQVLSCGLDTKSLSITISQKPLELSYYRDTQSVGILSSDQWGSAVIHCATVTLRAEGRQDQVRTLVDTFTNDYEAVRIISYSYENNLASDVGISALNISGMDTFDEVTTGTDSSGEDTTGADTIGTVIPGTDDAGTNVSGMDTSGMESSDLDTSARNSSIPEENISGHIMLVNLTINIYMCEK